MKKEKRQRLGESVSNGRSNKIVQGKDVERDRWTVDGTSTPESGNRPIYCESQTVEGGTPDQSDEVTRVKPRISERTLNPK